MRVQGHFVELCLLAFAWLQTGLWHLSRKVLQAVIFEEDNPLETIQLSLFGFA